MICRKHSTGSKKRDMLGYPIESGNDQSKFPNGDQSEHLHDLRDGMYQ